MTTFVHLRVHTEFSLVDSVVRVPELMSAAAAARMPAIALTDEHNLFAMVKFYREALKKGIKPIIGVDLLVAEAGERSVPSRLTLLCMNDVGYRNLTRLVTRAYLEGQQRGAPQVERAWMTRETTGGLIALSGGTSGDVGRSLTSGRPGDAERLLAAWLELFGPDRYYLELTRVGRPDEEAAIAATLSLAERHGGAGGRDQRRALPDAGGFRVARGARLHPRRHAARRPVAAAQVHAAAVPAQRRRDGRAVRRPAGGAGEHGRDRAPLQPRAAPRREHAAAVPGAGGPDDRGVPAAGVGRGPRAPAARRCRRSTPTPTGRGSRSSST